MMGNVSSDWLLSLRINKYKTVFLLFGLAFIALISTYSLSREVASDSKVYYNFYENLIQNGLHSIQGCQSFEPVYCVGSYAIAYIAGKDWLTHYAWIFVYYSVTLFAFIKFWDGVNSKVRYSFLSFLMFVFITINYVEPLQVSFLLRQYVSSAFLLLGVAEMMRKKNPVIACILAALIHFGSIPIAIVILAFSRVRYLFAGTLTAVCITFLTYLLNPYILEVFSQSVLHKISLYSYLNTSGDVSFFQEIKLLLYFAILLIAFRKHKNVFFFYITIYSLYLLSFQIDLFHLRYHKYLEAMIWPSVFFIYARIIPSTDRLKIFSTVVFARLTKNILMH